MIDEQAYSPIATLSKYVVSIINSTHEIQGQLSFSGKPILASHCLYSSNWEHNMYAVYSWDYTSNIIHNVKINSTLSLPNGYKARQGLNDMFYLDMSYPVEFMLINYLNVNYTCLVCRLAFHVNDEPPFLAPSWGIGSVTRMRIHHMNDASQAIFY